MSIQNSHIYFEVANLKNSEVEKEVDNKIKKGLFCAWYICSINFVIEPSC
jgi:hypothetical protein